MKKDIEWLRGRIKSFQESRNMFTDEFDAGVQQALEYVQELIDQLDEPEVLSQEWIDENVIGGDFRGEQEFWYGRFIEEEKVRNLLVPKKKIAFKQVHDKLRGESILSEKSFDYYWNCINDNVEIDEPGNIFVAKQDKPVIPKFVADYVERWKPEGLTICEWFTFGNNDMDDDIEKWLYNNTVGENRKREYLLIDAIRNGYKVEEEQKYQVIIKDGEYIRLFLCKHGDNVMIGTNDSYIENYPEVAHLTEKEIKDYDERYWVFAEEVAK